MKHFLATRRWWQILLAGVWLASSCALCAEADIEFEFDVHSPSVKVIRTSLVERYAALKEHFQTGVIGFTHDGLIAMREPGGLAAEMRARVERLVAEDNKDRGAMYREIARANGRPDWEAQFQYVFAERWISRAPVGWYYRDSSGQWVKKLFRGANGNAPANALVVAPFPGS
jgi:uncharacterized protein YdbL (DUF1318 family)